MVTVYFACGHKAYAAGADARPECAVCGEPVIRHTVTSRKVRVTGAVLPGPIATPTPVEPHGKPYQPPTSNRVN